MIKVNPSLGATQKLYPAYDGRYHTKYVELTIDKTEVPGNVVDFPLCIQGNEFPASFWSTVQAGGGELLVTNARTKRKLHRELEYINVAEGSEALALHVRVPSITTAQDEVLRIYYGNAAMDEPQESMTWRPEYVFVSHMADYNAGTQIWDSTKYRNHGTKGAGAAAPVEVAGTVGKAQQFVGADNQYINIGASQTLYNARMSLSLLVYRDAASRSVPIGSGLDGAGAPSIPGWSSLVSLSDKLEFHFSRDGNERVYIPSTSAIGVGTHYLTETYDGLAIRLFIDGELDATNTDYPGNLRTTRLANVHIGHDNRPAYPFPVTGLIDELRLSSVAWEPEWNALEHKTLLTPTVLYGISAEQSV